jgi:hypothetical protein
VEILGSIGGLLLSLFRAIPALESIVRQVIAVRDREREREAANRKTAKDAAVDAAIDTP